MKIISSIFCLIFVFACQDNRVPSGILPLEKMAPLVTEITLLETHYQSKYGVPSQYKSALDGSVKKVLKKANCNRGTFEKSLKYYAAHPTLQEVLNETILTNLSRKLR